MKNFLIAKFGQKEHIKQLKDGNIFFNSIETYRNDGTDYRGDLMEGRIPIDPRSIKIFDEMGKNIFDYVSYPDSIAQSIVGDENLMMFCAATITKNIVASKKDNIWVFNKEFQASVKDFGDYVLLLWTAELLEHISNAVDINGQRIAYDSGMILYRDLTDYEHTEEYRKTGSSFDRYFVKSQSYKNQNEWRVIINGEKESLVPNCGSGFLLKTYPFEYATIMTSFDFLNGTIEFG